MGLGASTEQPAGGTEGFHLHGVSRPPPPAGGAADFGRLWSPAGWRLRCVLSGVAACVAGACPSWREPREDAAPEDFLTPLVCPDHRPCSRPVPRLWACDQRKALEGRLGRAWALGLCVPWSVTKSGVGVLGTPDPHAGAAGGRWKPKTGQANGPERTARDAGETTLGCLSQEV